MQLALRTEHIPFSSLCAFFDAAEARQRAGQDIINMVMGRPDFLPAPHINEAVKKAVDDGQVHYTSNYGLLELRQEVARKLKDENGLGYARKPKSSSRRASRSAAPEHGRPAQSRRRGAHTRPAFLSYGSCVHMASGVPVFVPTEQAKGFQPEPDVLERHITPKTKLILINSPQNPTGTVYPRETLQGIADLAIKHDLIVVSDEINEKIIFDGEEHISIASLPGMRERTVVLNGFSKAYAMTGSRIGYAAGPERLIAPIYCAHQYSAMCPCTYAQWGAVAALRGPQGHIADMVKNWIAGGSCCSTGWPPCPAFPSYAPRERFTSW
ncbi:MAG: aminotransferase class I/II-fold pyridoxal phosphate-dependent enzyme [Bilophila wadsworthia]